MYCYYNRAIDMFYILLLPVCVLHNSYVGLWDLFSYLFVQAFLDLDIPSVWFSIVLWVYILFSVPCPAANFSCVWFFVTPWIVAHQAPLSIELSKHEFWNGLPFPFPFLFYIYYTYFLLVHSTSRDLRVQVTISCDLQMANWSLICLFQFILWHIPFYDLGNKTLKRIFSFFSILLYINLEKLDKCDSLLNYS